MAAKNAQHDIDTVLFFDEANTTDALGMIKEIIVDQRCNGRPLSLECGRLKFIVACNPYRRCVYYTYFLFNGATFLQNRKLLRHRGIVMGLTYKVGIKFCVCL